MLYLVIAHDGSDPDAPARRKAVRQQHLDEVRAAVESGLLKLGGALLDGAGEMVGSALLLEAESEAEVRAFLARDIYRTGGVWQSFEIYPFRRAVGVQL